MIYFQDSYITVTWDELNQCILVEWFGFFTSPQLRIAGEKVLTLINEQKATKIITDTSQSRLISPEDQNWIATEWQQRAVQAGLRQLVTVLPHDIIAQMAMNRLSNLLKEGELETTYFATAAEARQWLNFK
jgi:hypothetical protein